MDISRIIIRPLVTEKTNILNNSEPKVYCFVVDDHATKYQIMNAFAALYGFMPARVNTQNRKPGMTRTASLHPGYSKAFKIAYITLPKGKSIAVSTAEAEAQQEQATENKKNEASVTKAKTKGALKEVSSPSENLKEAKK